MTIRIDGTNTAANPGITGTDTDTGLQFGTDEIKVVTGGTTAVTVDSSQRVGIGTTSPTHPLTIKASSDVDQLYLQQSNVTDSGWKVHANASEGDLVFFRQGSGTDTRRLAFREDGGIMFGSDTAAANALDDYEEGTWTPQFSTTNDDWSSTANDQSGIYVKVGKMVHVSFRLQESRSAGTGALIVTNFPFDLSAGNRYVLALNPAFGGWGSTNAPRGGFGHNTTEVVLKKADGSDGRSVLDSNIDAASVSNPGMIGSMTYYIS